MSLQCKARKCVYLLRENATENSDLGCHGPCLLVFRAVWLLYAVNCQASCFLLSAQMSQHCSVEKAFSNKNLKADPSCLTVGQRTCHVACLGLGCPTSKEKLSPMLHRATQWRQAKHAKQNAILGVIFCGPLLGRQEKKESSNQLPWNWERTPSLWKQVLLSLFSHHPQHTGRCSLLHPIAWHQDFPHEQGIVGYRQLIAVASLLGRLNYSLSLVQN